MLFVNGKNEVSVGMMMDYEEGCDIWATMNSIYFNDNLNQNTSVCKYWMPLPKPPVE